METLVRVRPIILGAFFLGFLGAFFSLFADMPRFFLAMGSLAHLALTLFIATESYGSLSYTRGAASRMFARVFLLFSVIVVTGLLIFMVRLAIA